MRYRISIYFDARSPQEASEFLRAYAHASASVLGESYRITLANLDRRKTITDCLKWGVVIGLLMAVYVFAGVASGTWTWKPW